jgi:prepilin-type processing-associated H-X9-DG protein
MSQPPSIPYQTPEVQPKSSGLAIAALVCGIVGLIVPGVGLVGLILGIIALAQRKTPADPGKGMAIGGIVTGGLSLLCVPALLISILLPSLNRAREAANRIKCASNMRQIGLGLKLYANEFGGREYKYPPDLAHVLVSQDITADVFVCPSSNDDRMPQGTPVAQYAQLLQHGSGCCSYIYVPGLTDSAPADAVLLYEPIANHDGDGANFLFADGHVDWLTAPMATSFIKQIEQGVKVPR